MSSIIERIFWKVFDRKPLKRTADVAHAVVPVVSLTILGGLIGVNASNLPDESQTTANVIFSILSLSLFFMVMEILWESLSNRQFLRAILIGLTALYLPQIFSPVIAEVAGNESLIDGVLYGWIISFSFIAFTLSRTGEQDMIEMKSVDKGEHD